MNETKETDNIKYSCEFCKQSFVRERTLNTHICERKQRWLNKDLVGNRIGFQAWLQFYSKNTMSVKKNKTYEEFIKNSYYIPFVKFGVYCANVNVLNPSMYLNWLLKDNIKIDNWTSDSVYTRFLCEYLRLEDPYDAVRRGVEHCTTLGEKYDIQHNDVLRYGNINGICYAITTGKISPWMLWQSEGGQKFLSSLSEDQVSMINEYINPEQWALKFKREPELTKQISDLLKQAGY